MSKQFTTAFTLTLGLLSLAAGAGEDESVARYFKRIRASRVAWQTELLADLARPDVFVEAIHVLARTNDVLRRNDKRFEIFKAIRDQAARFAKESPAVRDEVRARVDANLHILLLRSRTAPHIQDVVMRILFDLDLFNASDLTVLTFAVFTRGEPFLLEPWVRLLKDAPREELVRVAGFAPRITPPHLAFVEASRGEPLDNLKLCRLITTFAEDASELQPWSSRTLYRALNERDPARAETFRENVRALYREVYAGVRELFVNGDRATIVGVRNAPTLIRRTPDRPKVLLALVNRFITYVETGDHLDDLIDVASAPCVADLERTIAVRRAPPRRLKRP